MLRINEADELPDDLSGTVGVTAGASAPEALVEEVIARLAPAEGVTEVTVTTEDEYFPPPPELRELLRAVGSMLGFLAGRPAAEPGRSGGRGPVGLGGRRPRPAGLVRPPSAMIGP